MQTPPQIIVVSNKSQSEWLLAMMNGLKLLGSVQVLSENEAFITVTTSPPRPSLIIADASAIRKNITTYVSQLHDLQPDLPIIVVTSSPTWGRARSLFRAGVADYTRKSLDVHKITRLWRFLIMVQLVSNL